MKLKLCRCFGRRKRSKGSDAPWAGIGLFEPTATPPSASSGAQDQQVTAVASLDGPGTAFSAAKCDGSHGSVGTAEFQTGGSSGSGHGTGASSNSRALATNAALRARLPNVSMPTSGHSAPGESLASADSCLTLEDIKRLRDAVPPGHYAVELHRMDPKERYGLQWDPSQLERCSVRVVSKVIPGSLADEWNKSSVLGCDVRVGDELVKVNGKGGKLEIMSAQLAKRRVLLEFRPRDPRAVDGMGEPAEEPPSVPAPGSGPTPTPSFNPSSFSPNALDEVRLDIQSPSSSQDHQQGVAASETERALALAASLVPASAESPAAADAPEETSGAPGAHAASAVESRHEGSGTAGTTVGAPRGTGEDGRNQPGEPEQEGANALGTSIEDRLQQLLHHNYGLPAPEEHVEQDQANPQEHAEVVKPSISAASKVPTEVQSLEPEPEMPTAPACSFAPMPSPSEEAPVPPSADAGHEIDGFAQEENAAPVPPANPLAAIQVSADAGLVLESEQFPASLEDDNMASSSPEDPFWEEAALAGRGDIGDFGLVPPAPVSLALDQRM